MGKTGSDTMSKWKIQGSRVYGNGQSYNCTNKVTAEQLHNTLNNYEKTVNLQSNIDKQFDNITRQLIQTNLSLNILKDDMERLTKELNNVSTD